LFNHVFLELEKSWKSKVDTQSESIQKVNALANSSVSSHPHDQSFALSEIELAPPSDRPLSISSYPPSDNPDPTDQKWTTGGGGDYTDEEEDALPAQNLIRKRPLPKTEPRVNLYVDDLDDEPKQDKPISVDLIQVYCFFNI